MSERRLPALEATSAVMPAVMRLEAGLVRSIAPMENCVILASELVGVQEVRAIELTQITESTKTRGSERSANPIGTPKKRWVSHTPTKLRSGTPTDEIQSGSSIPARTSLPWSFAFFFPRRFLKRLVKISGLPTRAISEPTTIMVTPHQRDH